MSYTMASAFIFSLLLAVMVCRGRVEGCCRTTPKKEPEKTTEPYCDLLMDRSERHDCGYPGITKAACEAEGCCFDNTYTDAPVCFCRNVASYLTYNLDRLKRAGHVPVHGVYNGNCKCKGIELGNRGGGPRTLKVVCSLPGTNKGKCKGNSITCEYKGNPHHCKQYPGKAVKVYEELLDAVGPNQCNIAKGGGSSCPSSTKFNTRNTCTDVDFICQ